MYSTAHTIALQDGSLFNLKRRVGKQQHTLVTLLAKVHDGRSDQGKRHDLPVVLLILFAGVTAGYTSIDQCHLFAVAHQSWMATVVPFAHGVPDPTTISRAIQVCDVASLLAAFRTWQQLIMRVGGTTASLDGKTLRGVHGTGTVSHILSLFVHQTKQTIGQVGVTGKENEIPAGQRLLKQTPIAGLTIVADAIHTQQRTVTTIIKKHAHYLLMVKDNQRQLAANIALGLADATTHKTTTTEDEYDRTRRVTRIVTLSNDPALVTYCAQQGWTGLRGVGSIRRYGSRNDQPFDETVYFITSRSDLSAQHAAQLVKDHWQIENNLHWQKDWTFLEDRQTVRKGNAPQVMAMVRSMAIGLLHWLGVASVSRSLTALQMHHTVHRRMLAYAAVI